MAAELAERDLDDIRERVTVEDAGDGVAHIEHQHPQAAVGLVGTGAFLVGGLAHAADGGERTVDAADDLADGNLAGGLREPVAAELAAHAGDEASLLQRLHDLFEELDRELLVVGQLGDLHQRALHFDGDPEIDERAEGVFAFFGELHITTV